MARLRVQRSRIRTGGGDFLCQLHGVAGSWGAAGRAMERAPGNFRVHDRLGNADGADWAGRDTLAFVRSPPPAGRGGGLVLPRCNGCNRLPEPLVSNHEPCEGNQQFHGGDPDFLHDRVSNSRVDHQPTLARHERMALAVRSRGNSSDPVGRSCLLLFDGPAKRCELAGGGSARLGGRKTAPGNEEAGPSQCLRAMPCVQCRSSYWQLLTS